MERGIKSPTIETIIRLARRYRTSADYLLGLDDTALPALTPEEEELLAIVRQLPAERRAELREIAEVLLRRSAHLRVYDMLITLIEQVGGVDAVEALEAALRAQAAGDAAGAQRLIDAFFAGRNAQKTGEKARHDA